MIWKCGCQVAKWLGVSENRPPRRLPGRHRRLTDMFENGSKMFPNCLQMGPEIVPKWVPDGSKIAPWRPPGGFGGPWGTPGVPRQIFERFWGPFGVRFGVPKSSQNQLKIKLKSKVALNAHFWPSGGLLGRFGGPFWGDLGVLFGYPRREAGICEK